MATADHDSGLDLDLGAAASKPGPRPTSLPAGQQVWLDGDVLACACPDCGAPMSIRLWLGVADCWRCGASIELSDQQQREAMRLWRDRQSSERAQTRREDGSITPTMLPTAKAAHLPQPPPLPRRRPATETPRGTRARSAQPPRKVRLGVSWGDVFKDLPAWLVSLVLHMVALLLLGLWIIPPREPQSITLATSVSRDALEGYFNEPEKPERDTSELDDPAAIPVEELAAMVSPGRAEVLYQPQVAPPLSPLGMLPSIADLSTAPAAAAGSMFAGRDPGVRGELLRREGGTDETEAAVTRGLQWLARHQNADGSWSLDAWNRAPKATGEGTGLGSHSDTAGTALALLPFLGAGQTHLKGDYREEVFQGLRWLIYAEQEDGDLRGPGAGRMYAQGQAAIALSEAYAMTGDSQLRDPAQRALDFIVKAQHRAGGWRYDPGMAGDTSVIGWQLMALRSGKMAYLRVPNGVFELSERYLDSAATDRYQSQYAYQPHRRASPVMTAEALLCRQYLGWPRDHDGLRLGVAWLLGRHPPEKRSPNIYYWYYATQVMHHMGGRAWNRWNARMRYLLVEMQQKEGPMAGSWDPVGPHAASGGRIYMTALAICTLEVYYRYLPMYRPDIVKEFDARESGPHGQSPDGTRSSP